MRLHQVHHPEPIIKEKVNFFLNMLTFYTHTLEKNSIDGIHLDNTISVLEKIIYQIEFNNEKARRYVDNHLQNPTYAKNNFIIEKLCFWVQGYEEWNNEVITYLSLSNTQRQKYLENNRLSLLLKGKVLIENLNKNLVNLLENLLIKYLQCGCSLKKHSKELDEFAYFLAVEFIFTGRTKNKLSDIIQSILDKSNPIFFKNINIENHNNHKNDITFNEQIHALISIIFKKRQYQYAILILRNTSLSAHKKAIHFKNITLLDSQHPKAKKIARAFHKRLPFSPHLKLKNDCFILIKIKYSNPKLARENAINETAKFLEIIYTSEPERNIFIDRKYIFFSNDLSFSKLGYSVHRIYDKIEERDLETLSYMNSFFKQKHSIVQHLDTIEGKFYINLNSQNIAQLSDYLENLSKKHFNFDIIAKILNNRKKMLDLSIASILENNTYILGLNNLNNLKYSFINYSKFQNKKFILPQKTQSITKDYFFNYLHEKIRNIHQYQLKDYYQSILIESYEIRNQEAHTGKSFEKSVIKMRLQFIPIIKNYRFILFQTFLKNPNAYQNIDELIDYLQA